MSGSDKWELAIVIISIVLLASAIYLNLAPALAQKAEWYEIRHFTVSGEVTAIERPNRIDRWPWQGYALIVSNTEKDTEIFSYIIPEFYGVRVGDVVIVHYREEKWVGDLPEGCYRLVPLVDDIELVLEGRG